MQRVPGTRLWPKSVRGTYVTYARLYAWAGQGAVSPRLKWSILQGQGGCLGLWATAPKFIVQARLAKKVLFTGGTFLFFLNI